MIKIENVEVFGFEAAIRGMRNPLNSWDKSDSFVGCETHGACCECYVGSFDCNRNGEYIVGKEDYKLMKQLIAAGTDHSKFMRMLHVQCDINAPLYWWKEFRTYRKGRKFMDDGDEFTDPDELDIHIETNSCSTMHKIHEKPFATEDFSCEHLCDESMIQLGSTIYMLNYFRERYNENKDKKWWWQIIQLLPSSYNQKRTVDMNYTVLRAMYHARKSHKLDEWRDFCKWIESLPYSELITGGAKNGEA